MAEKKPAVTKTDLTDAERARIPAWHEKWVNISLRTATQTTEERNRMIESTHALYEMGGMKRPKQIIFCPSPYSAQITAGFLAAFAAIAKHDSLPTPDKALKGFKADEKVRTYIDVNGKSQGGPSYLGIDTSGKETKNGVENAVIQAVSAGLQMMRSQASAKKASTKQDAKISETMKKEVTNKPNQAIYTVTGATCFELLHRNITTQAYQNVWDGTSDVIHRMTNTSTDAIRRQIESNMKEADWLKKLAMAFDDRYGSILAECASSAQNMYTGGNFWGSGSNFISFYQHNCDGRLPIDFSNWAHYETISMLSGFRYVHEEFCVLSDFPEIFKLDERLLPHGETTASHRWRDGFEMFHWHGTAVPGEWIMNKKNLTPTMALEQSNLELRRAACEILGWESILTQLKAKTLDKHKDPQMGELVQVTIPGRSGMNAVNAKFLRVECGTGRKFAIGIPPQCNTVIQAQAWLAGLEDGQFTPPEVRA